MRVDGDRVGRAVAAAVRAAQVDVDPLDVRAAEVADRDVVGAAERAEFDALDIVQVHGDVRDIAEEQRASAVGDDVDVLGGVRAEEQQHVGAVLALDRVVAVARVPLEHVVAGAEERDVVAVVAEHEVVAVAAEDRVGALAAEEGVIAGAAVERQLDDAGRHRGRGDAVVAAVAVDHERVVRAFRVRDVHPGRQAEHRHGGARAEDIDDVVAVGPVVGHDVRRRVARGAADRAREIDVHLGHVGAGEVVHRDRVGAAERVEVDLLDIVQVHDDVAEVAREHARARRSPKPRRSRCRRCR